MTQALVKAELEKLADPDKAAFFPRFFRTGPGEYGEGDRFLGVTVPEQRKVARRFRDLGHREVVKLLDDPFHECRLTALFILADQFRRADPQRRQQIVKVYFDKMDRINNWDLVDASAYKILGAYLDDKTRTVLDRLAGSGDLWRQRISIVATYHFIRRNDFTDTLRIARTLRDHEHDLIHKAVGWMLREVGNRDRARLERFLNRHCRRMPRTMLRYAIEKLPEKQRRAYLRGDV